MAVRRISGGRNTIRGFTLLELLVVLMVVGVLLSLVAPGLNSVRSRDLADSVDRLCLSLNQARQEAMLSSRPWRLEIDPVEKRFRFQQRLGAEFVPLNKPPFSETRLRPDIQLAEFTINGQAIATSGQVYLFPTGEQDAFSLTLIEGEHRRVLSMGPLGPAEVLYP